jgi:hypothetical protein
VKPNTELVSDSCGDVFTLEEFQYNAECGGFIPDDGVGYFASDTYESNVSVWSAFEAPYWATHVVWYNR